MSADAPRARQVLRCVTAVTENIAGADGTAEPAAEAGAAEAAAAEVEAALHVEGLVAAAKNWIRRRHAQVRAALAPARAPDIYPRG